MYATKLNATDRRAELGGYRGFLQKCKIEGVKTESGFFLGVERGQPGGKATKLFNMPRQFFCAGARLNMSVSLVHLI